MSNRTFLRWAGSKQKLLPELKEYWSSDYNRYIEPFMGSAKLYFHLKPQDAILSDINVELVETFNQIKKNPYPVFKILKSFKVSEFSYYQIRSQNPQTLGINQRVARFIFLNKLCFNGLYRTNLDGKFNVPYSGLKKLDWDSEYDLLKSASSQLKSAKVYCNDFEKIIRTNVRKNDFLYIDPPYAVENRRIFKQYGPQCFGLDDLKRMQKLLDHIDKRGAKFLLSYAYCTEAIESFRGWNTRKKFTQRNIAGFSEHRRKAAELLVTNI